MSSVTHGDPDPEGTPEEEARRRRARFSLRRRRHPDDVADVAELDDDDIAELTRRSSERASQQPASAESDEDHEDIATRVDRLGPTPRTPADPDDPGTDDSVDWGSFVAPSGAPPRSRSPEPASAPAAVERPSARPVTAPAPWVTSDEEADELVIATAFDQGFAEPVPGEEPARGLTRLRRLRAAGPSDAEVARLRHNAEAAVAEQDVGRQAAADAEDLAVAAQQEAVARAATEAAARADAERAAAERAALADAEIQRREEAERRAAEQAALAAAAHEERLAAESAAKDQALLAQQAAAARDQAEAHAHEVLAQYEKAAAEQQAQLTALQDALGKLEAQTESQAQARAEAEQAAAEQAAARAEAEARAADLQAQVSEAQALLEAAEPPGPVTGGKHRLDPVEMPPEPPTAEAQEPSEDALPEQPGDVVPDPATDTTDDVPATAFAGKKRSYHSKRGSDSLAPLALLAALACAAVLGRQAYFGRLTTELSLSIGLTVGALALVIFAMRAANSSRSVHLSTRGELKLVVGDSRHEFDLANPDIQVEMAGTPGQRGWRILIVRKNLSPVSIGARTVDPKSFTEAVRQWRPDL